MISVFRQGWERPLEQASDPVLFHQAQLEDRRQLGLTGCEGRKTKAEGANASLFLWCRIVRLPSKQSSRSNYIMYVQT
jgi:hypothetical protein